MPESRRLRVWRIRLLMFLAVIGPGFITANVDNDAGGIYTYSAAGAQFGYLLLWVMIPMTVALVVVQKMSARMGAVTGKGLSDLIREEYGLRVTFLMMVGLVITNFENVTRRPYSSRIRSLRPYPRGIRPAGHVLDDGGAGYHQLRQRSGGI